jgi:bifunctional DNA-binding transcriptional regulator/antitoxin component of YhaV-PrlF toxin-antitoxin module
MRVTSKGQVTIPQHVRDSMGILPAETEVEFLLDDNGHWYLNKVQQPGQKASRFRSAHQIAKPLIGTDDIMALTRGSTWPLS